MPKPLKPRSIKFTVDQEKYLKQVAKAQKHKKISKVVKRLVDRDMGVSQ